MKSYFALFKMTFKGELQYRAKAISGIITQLFWGAMYISLYTAFMKNGSVNGFTIAQMASYIWLGQAFFAMKFVAMPKGAAKEIVGGNVCYKFTRPINIYSQWYAELVGQKLSATLLKKSSCMPLPWTLARPGSPVRWSAKGLKKRLILKKMKSCLVFHLWVIRLRRCHFVKR